MNFRLRFALLFSLFVAIILLISSATIYVLYYNYREEDFYERVKTEGLEFYDIVSQIKNPEEAVATKMIQGIHNNTLWDEQLMVLDSNARIVNVLPDTLQVTFDSAYIHKIKRLKELQYTDADSRQYVAVYIPDSKNYIIASGFDIAGLKKQENLRYILGGVFVGGLLFTAALSFIFVTEAFKPLVKLSYQMQRTTELNMNERIDEGPGKDELKQIARNFNAMLERLNKAFESRKSFVHHASHELRTPLATMLAQTESALNKDLTEAEYKSLLQSLKEDQIELIELTNSLLLLSQYEKMHYSADWPTVRVDEMLYDITSSSKKMFDDINVSIEFEEFPGDEKELLVKGNEVLLKSVFRNLIKNAYLYSNDKNVHIVIHPGTAHIRLDFINKGTQLSASEMQKLMVPFFRGENAMNKKGFGLGLSIVNRILFLHNGNLQYTPVGTGSNMFTVILPGEEL